MKPKKDIFQILKENQHKLNQRPSKQAWRRLEQRLEERRNQGKYSFYRHTSLAAGILALVALISLIAVLVDQNSKPNYLAINQPGPVQLEELTYTDVDMEALKVVEFTNQVTNRGANITEGNRDQLLVPSKLLVGKKMVNDASQMLIKKFEWLVGEWRQINDQQISTETWTLADDLTLEGKGTLSTEQGNQLFSEIMKLQQVGGEVVLSIPLQKGQSLSKYKLVKMSDNTAVFENRKVAFPQLIILHKQAEDHFSTIYQNSKPIQMSNEQLNYLQQRNSFSSQYLRRDLEKVKNNE